MLGYHILAIVSASLIASAYVISWIINKFTVDIDYDTIIYFWIAVLLCGSGILGLIGSFLWFLAVVASGK